MMISHNTKRACNLYFSEAMELLSKNGKVDDYDITVASGINFENIGNFKKSILEFANSVYDNLGKCYCSIYDNKISILNTFGFPCYTFSFILTKSMTFSGTVGINQIEKDGGFSKHIKYLSCFIEPNSLKRRMSSVKYTFSDDSFMDNPDHLIECYKIFYNRLLEVFKNDPVAIYSLMSGIKHHYELPDVGICLDGDSYSVLDFTMLKSTTFINNRDQFNCTISDTTPMLKIDYQGNKILHLRTKLESKNSTFRLKFFIETGHKFYNMFKVDRSI
jgi:hypothetical protein